MNGGDVRQVTVTEASDALTVIIFGMFSIIILLTLFVGGITVMVAYLLYLFIAIPYEWAVIYNSRRRSAGTWPHT